MTNQDINREIAEAMTAQGFDEGLAWELQDKYIGTPDGHMILVPHNFTDPCYLLPALEAYYRGKPVTIAFSPQSDGGWIAQVDEYEGAEVELANAKLVSALRNAFAAALGVGE